MTAHFFGPALADDRHASRLADAAAGRLARSARPDAPARTRIARVLVAFALRLSPAVAETLPPRPARPDGDGWLSDAPGVAPL